MVRCQSISPITGRLMAGQWKGAFGLRVGVGRWWWWAGVAAWERSGRIKGTSPYSGLFSINIPVYLHRVDR